MDLFTPVVEPSRYHPIFAFIKNTPNPHNEAVLRNWADGFVDRDGKFLKEFQTSFDPSFWELYLHAVLKELGCSVDFSHQRPDFCVVSTPRFIVEATVALHTSGFPPATDTYDAPLPDNLNELNRDAIIRLSNSISSKHRKYKESYCRLKHATDLPFIIAVAPFDRPYFQLQTQRAIEALLFGYYVDEEAYLNQPILKPRLSGHFRDSVHKDSGAPINLGLFGDVSMREVSAIIHSTCATWGKVRALSDDPNQNIYFDAIYYNPDGVRPRLVRQAKADYREGILDGLRVYHNPYAEYPLDPSVFKNEVVFQSYFDKAVDDWVYEFSPRNLLFRRVITYRFKN